MDSLPNELIIIILKDLDIASMSKFMLANKIIYKNGKYAMISLIDSNSNIANKFFQYYYAKKISPAIETKYNKDIENFIINVKQYEYYPVQIFTGEGVLCLCHHCKRYNKYFVC